MLAVLAPEEPMAQSQLWLQQKGNRVVDVKENQKGLKKGVLSHGRMGWEKRLM
jgi:hypothetical protein